MKSAVLICPIPEREHFADKFFSTFPYSGEELIVVDTVQSPCEVMDWETGMFDKIHHIRLDEERSHIPIERNPVPLKINVAARYMQANKFDNFFYTHLECFFQGEIGGGFAATEDLLLFIPTEKEDEDGNWVPTTGSDRPGSWWWYAVWVPVKGFCEIRGFDENLLEGIAGDDDQLAYCWQNSGRKWGFLNYPTVKHRWHLPMTKGVEEDLIKNWAIVNEYKDDKKRVVSNPDDYDWGSLKTVEEIVSVRYEQEKVV